jgi:hypothetical protein
MANDEDNRTRYRGMFGYEGEGFMDEPRPRPRYADLESSPERGWNIGRGADRDSYRGRGPKNYQRSDERIREEVCERLTMDHDVDASDVEVTVRDGVVTLSGTVHERYAKRTAEDICESVRGVKDVQNDLRVAR